MFDLFKSIGAAFVGRVKHDPEARKLVWLTILFAFLTLGISIFTAYVSYQRYLDFIHNLPNSETSAWILSGGIAGAMLILTSVLALFSIELWIKGKSRISWQAAIIFSVIGLFIGVTDFHMNTEGADDVAELMAGNVQSIDDQAIFDRYNEQIATHEERKAAVLKKYTWKGNVWFKPSKWHPVADWAKDTAIVNHADRQISILEAAKTAALSRDTQRYQTETTKREERKRSSHNTLLWAVRLAYILQFLVSLGLAYCGLVFEEALERAPKNTLYDRMSKSNGVNRIPDDALQKMQEQLNQLITAQANKQEDTETKKSTGGVQKIGFDQGQKSPQIHVQKTEVDKEQIKAIIIDILGSVTGGEDTKYLYRHFDEDDAKESRKKRSNKAIAAKEEAIRLKKKGLTNGEIAEKLGKSDRQITRYLNS